MRFLRDCIVYPRIKIHNLLNILRFPSMFVNDDRELMLWKILEIIVNNEESDKTANG